MGKNKDRGGWGKTPPLPKDEPTILFSKVKPDPIMGVTYLKIFRPVCVHCGRPSEYFVLQGIQMLGFCDPCFLILREECNKGEIFYGPARNDLQIPEGYKPASGLGAVARPQDAGKDEWEEDDDNHLGKKARRKGTPKILPENSPIRVTNQTITIPAGIQSLFG